MFRSWLKCRSLKNIFLNLVSYCLKSFNVSSQYYTLLNTLILCPTVKKKTKSNRPLKTNLQDQNMQILLACVKNIIKVTVSANCEQPSEILKWPIYTNSATHNSKGCINYKQLEFIFTNQVVNNNAGC